MELKHDVVANLVVQGDGAAIAKLGQVGGAADRMSSAISGIGHSVGAAIGSVGEGIAGAMDRVGSMLTSGVKWGGMIAGAAAAHQIHAGLTQVNAQLEQSKIGFASLFSMFGAATDTTAGLGIASDLITKMRADASALPGEFQDFVSMAQVLTSPILQAGKGVQAIRDMTRDTVVAAANLSIPFEVASREMSMLLAGNVSSHMPLAAKLGIGAQTQVAGKDWHEASAAQRFDFITARLSKAKEALPLYERSWIGLTSTLHDKWRAFIGAATGPLFERMKGSMFRMTTWADAHQAQIGHLADVVGAHLGNAWLRVEHAAERIPAQARKISAHWSEIRGQVLGVGHALKEGFDHAWPIVHKVGSFIGHELEHPARFAKELLALRVGAGIAGHAPGMVNAGFGAARMLGMGASAGGAGGGVAAAGAVAGIGGGAVLAGGAAAALVGIGAIATAIFDDTLGSATRARSAVDDLSSSWSGMFDGLAEKDGILRQGLGLTGAAMIDFLDKSLWPLNQAAKLAGDEISWLNNNLEGFIKTGLGLGDATVKVDALQVAIGTLTDAATHAIPGLSAITSAFELLGFLKGGDQFEGVPWEAVDKTTTAPLTSSIVGTMKAPALEKPKVPQTIVDARGSRIEIKIDARNESPDRVVRRMFDSIGRAIARPMTSTYGPGRSF